MYVLRLSSSTICWRNPQNFGEIRFEKSEQNERTRRIVLEGHTVPGKDISIHPSNHSTAIWLVDGAHGGGSAGPLNVPPALMHSVHSAGPTRPV